ncbi:MAG TPA: 3-dehydroquinate synthase family protein [Candidatus Micrarchaeia archaeon]|nr:3-dehydroquinate synthase family protein [Candidatus Micrarchaeia archaeon]
MIRVEVRLGARSYPVVVAAGGLDAVGAAAGAAAGPAGGAALVADGGLPDGVVNRVRASLDAAGLRPICLRLRGERAKRLATVERLCAAFRQGGVDRDGVVVALGGGVVGDVAGFAAAVYLRGIALVHCPTTLLAMVDSALGGKTAVNLAAAKNQLGTLHQPRAVLCDPELLRSLPRRDRRAAFGEIVKYGMVSDPDLLGLLTELQGDARPDDPRRLETLIARCCACKAEVVGDDEHDHGRRAILNYGHTVGHALEATCGYGRLRHGEAVAIGMRVAGRLSVELRGCPAAAIEEQDARLSDFGLGRLPAGLAVDPAAVLAATRHDKKTKGGRTRWVLLEGPGRPTAGHVVPEAILRRHLQQVLAG